MTTLFKPTRPYPLPAAADVVVRDGKRCLRLMQRGKTAHYPLSQDGTHYLKPAAKWAADVRLADGRRRRVRFSPNREAAAVMLADLLKRIEAEKAGVVDRTADHRERPLTAHLDDWRASLSASGRGDEYLDLKLSRARAACDGCGFAFTADLSADRLEAFLRDLRATEGRSVQTSNDWLQAVRPFVRWLVANDRLDRDPFARLKPGNAKLDPRRRGDFSPPEVAALMTTTAASATTFRGLGGRDRRMLYRVALGTGFRAAESANPSPPTWPPNCGRSSAAVRRRPPSGRGRWPSARPTCSAPTSPTPACRSRRTAPRVSRCGTSTPCGTATSRTSSGPGPTSSRRWCWPATPTPG